MSAKVTQLKKSMEQKYNLLYCSVALLDKERSVKLKMVAIQEGKTSSKSINVARTFSVISKH